MYEKVLEKIIEYFKEELDDPSIEITAESDLMDDLELSSLEILKSLVYLEVETGIIIPEKLLRKMVTVSDVAKVICDIVASADAETTAAPNDEMEEE